MTTQTIHVDMYRAFTMEPGQFKSYYTGTRPPHRSIDNDKIIRGRPVDRRPNRLTQLPANRDDRPRGADRGGRPQQRSLPPSKDRGAADRNVISAPSKELNAKANGPMPKINTLVHHDKAKSRTLTKPDDQKSSTSNSTRASDKAVQRDERKDRTITTGLNDVNRANEDTRRSDRVPVPVGSDTIVRSPTKHRESTRHLPPDDHGPVNPLPKPITNKQREEEEQRRSEEARKKREEEFKREMEKQMEHSPQKRNLKSAKTDKTDNSWTTIKTKTTDSSHKSSPTKAKTSFDISGRGDVSDRSNKRREVTIVDPKTARRYETDTDDDDEAFMHEYRHYRSLRHKDFKEMTDEEKVSYFRDHLKMRTDQIKNLTFHPKITEPKSIHRAYTGIETCSWSLVRQKSGKRPKSRKVYANKKITTVAPNQRKTYILSRLQGVTYRHINSVYGASPREHREKRFYEKLERLQSEEMQDKLVKRAERERNRIDAKLKQRKQLRDLRMKFEDDAWRRFMTQYVTSKVVEAEYSNRQDYGLPNDLGRERMRTYHGPSRRSKPARPHHKANKQKYSNLFNFSVGPEMKTNSRHLKFEGIDTVYIDTEDELGNRKRKRQDVKALMSEAQRILDQSDTEDTDFEDSPRYAPPIRTKTLPERRPYRRKSRPQPRDDKSPAAKTASKSKASNKEQPSNITEFFDRKKLNRYKYEAKGIDTMKENLLKDSDALNKNEKLAKVTKKVEKEKEKDIPNKDKINREKEKPVKEKTVSSTDRDMRTPPPSPRKETQTVKTITTITKKTLNGKDPETMSVKTWKDEPETQIGIETARDRETSPSKPKGRTPSRQSVVTNTNGHTESNKPKQRAPSLQSVKESPPQTRELPPVRPPSRSSIVKATTPPKRKASDAGQQNGQPNGHQNGQQSVQKTVTVTQQITETKTEQRRPSTFLTDHDEPTILNGHINGHQEPGESPPSTSANDKQKTAGTRRDSNVSIQQTKKPSSILVSKQTVNNSRVSLREILDPPRAINEQSTNGNRSPVLQEEPKSKREEPESKPDQQKTVNKTVNGHVTTPERETSPPKSPPKPQPKVSTTVSVKEDVVTTETSNTTSNKGKAVKRKKSIKQTTKVNGHDPSKDTMVPREKYEKKGQQKRRDRSSSGGKRRPGSRKRSTSGGRGRKRSTSRERKKASPKARFPDINKRDGKWEITARTTTEKEDEYETEIKPSSKNTDNQWRNLVEKYIRQPSPKIAKADDRSLLDSNYDDDDDEMDIFKRAQKRYGLDDDDDDDDSDV